MVNVWGVQDTHLGAVNCRSVDMETKLFTYNPAEYRYLYSYYLYNSSRIALLSS
jgi:hypothetical protein